MKIHRIRLLIPLFLFFGIIFSSLCSLTVYAAPTAPDSVTISISMNGTTVTQAAKGSKIMSTASPIKPLQAAIMFRSGLLAAIHLLTLLCRNQAHIFSEFWDE